MRPFSDSNSPAKLLVSTLVITLLTSSLMIIALSCSPGENESYHVADGDYADPMLLPWHFVIQSRLSAMSSSGDPISSKIGHSAACSDPDPVSYHIQNNWRPNDTLTAIVFYTDFEERSAISHFNLKTDEVWSDYPLDLDGDGQCEVALVYTHLDSLWLDAYSPRQGRQAHVLLVVGVDRTGNGTWDGRGFTIGHADVDSDGRPELLVGTDVGYDLYPRELLCVDVLEGEILWRVPYAGIISRGNVLLEPAGHGADPLLVFGVASKGNAAESPTMDDQHAYVVAVSRQGKLMWQHEVGGVFDNALPVILDSDEDGLAEIFVPRLTESSLPRAGKSDESIHSLLVLSTTGELIDSLADIPQSVIHSFSTVDIDGDGRPDILALFSDKRLVVYDEKLDIKCETRLTSQADLWTVDDILGNGRRQILLSTRNNSLLLLDQDLGLLARITLDATPQVNASSLGYPAAGEDGLSIVLSADRGRLHYVLKLEPREWSIVLVRRPGLLALVALLPTAMVIMILAIGWLRIRRKNKLISSQRDALRAAQVDLERRIAERTQELSVLNEELRTSEEKYRLLVENAGATIALIDREGCFLFVNELAARSKGMKPSELVGKTMWELFPEDIANRQVESIRRVIDSSQGETIDARTRAFGQWRWYTTNLQPFRDASGRVTAAMIISHDITDRKDAEEALIESEGRYRAIADSAMDCIFCKDLDRRYTFVNPAMERLFGKSASELLGLTPEDIFDPESAALIREVDELALSGEVATEIRTLPIKGQTHIFHTIQAPIRDASGKVVAISGIVRDITEMREAETQVQLLGQAFDQTMDEIAIADLEGNIQYVNSSWARAHGYSQDELIGKHLSISHSQQQYEDEIVAIISELKQKGVFMGEVDHARKDGTTFPMRMSCSMITDDSGEPIAMVAIARDITEQKRAQASLEASEERFREMVDLLPQSVFEIDIAGEVTFANRSALESYGYDQTDVNAGLSVRQLFVPEDIERLLVNIQKRLRNEWPDGYEYTALRKDGSTFPVLTYTSPIMRGGATVGLRGVIIDMTDRKEARDRLEASQTRYRELFDSVVEGLARVDENEVIQFCNPAFADIFDTDSVEDLVGRKIGEFISKEENEVLIAQTALRRTGVASSYELEINTARGITKTVMISVAPQFDSDRKYIGAFGAVLDITNRKQAEEALRESEEKYRGIFDESVAAVYIFDADKNFVDSNQSGLELLGYSRSELLSMNVSDVDADPTLVIPAHARLQSGGRLINYEHQLVRKDGRVITVLNNSRPLTDANGSIIGMQSTLLDISQRKEAEDALRESEQFNRAVIENSPLGISVRSAKGKLLSVNEAWITIWQIPDEELQRCLAAEPSEIIFDESDAYLGQWQEAVENVYKNGGYLHVPELPLRRHRSGTSRWISQTFYAINDPQGRVDRVVILTEDITDRKRAEDEIRRSEQARYNQIREIAGGVSHEIYNSLYPAMVALEKLQLGSETTSEDRAERQTRLLQMTSTAVRRAIGMTELVTEYARLENRKTEELVNLKSVIDGIVGEQRSRIEDIQAEVAVEVSHDLSCLCSEEHAHSLFSNLIVNSLDAIADASVRRVALKAEVLNDRIKIVITDTGAGITSENLPKVFDPFFSTKPRTGTGLGLAIVKKIVTLYGGEITVRSSLDTGTEFVIFLKQSS